jgi:hypothetical protein
MMKVHHDYYQRNPRQRIICTDGNDVKSKWKAFIHSCDIIHSWKRTMTGNANSSTIVNFEFGLVKDSEGNQIGDTEYFPTKLSQ